MPPSTHGTGGPMRDAARAILAAAAIAYGAFAVLTLLAMRIAERIF